MVTTRYAIPEPSRTHSTRARLGAPDAKQALPLFHGQDQSTPKTTIDDEKLNSQRNSRFSLRARARSFRRAGRHTANVKKWVITLVIGTVTGLLAFAMEHSITVLVRARLTLISRAALAVAPEAPETTAAAASALAAAVVSGSALAAAASALVVFVAPAAAGAGVALVMASLNGVHVPDLLGFEAVAVKAVGAALAVASGAPAGPEGPLVHVGAGVASLCTRQMTAFAHGGWRLDAFHNDADGRDFLSAGVAAGLAAAFGAPVGGVLFSLEEASTHWSHAATWRSLLCAALAVFVSAVARAATPREGAWAGKDSASLLSLSGSTGVIPIDSESSRDAAAAAGDDDAFAYFLWELPLFAALAAVAAAIGATLTRVSGAIAPHRPKQPWARVLEASLVAGVCAAIAVLAAAALGACSSRPETGAGAAGGSADHLRATDAAFRLGCPRGGANQVGTLLLGLRDDIISELLSSSSAFAPASVAVALAVLLATTPLACDCAFPAGLFMPTVMWGACLGSLAGAGARALARLAAGDAVAAAVSPGAYAAVGAASALAGMFRSSISLVVIVVEGTGRVGALTPLIVGVAVANLVGPRVHGESFYDAQLRAKGVPFLRHDHARAPTEGDVARARGAHDACDDATSTHFFPTRTRVLSTHGARRVVASLVAKPPLCLEPTPLVSEIVQALSRSTHNGFPVVARDPETTRGDEAVTNPASSIGGVPRNIAREEDELAPTAAADGGGRLIGFILRSQLMTLLARRAFIGSSVASALDSDASFDRLARADATDAAMRTFHHRHHFGDRGVSCSAAAVERLGLSRRETHERVDLRDYMKIAPLAVHAECSAWRAAGYFINAGLRHLPVVDSHNRVVGVLTRRDLVPGFASANDARSDARAERDESRAVAAERPFSP
jgi:chloride channel 7